MSVQLMYPSISEKVPVSAWKNKDVMFSYLFHFIQGYNKTTMLTLSLPQESRLSQ